MIQITGANGSSVFFSAPFNLQDQVWHMLDVTYDGTSATVYLDGQLIGSAALTVNTVVPGSGLQVGGGGGGNTIDSDEAAIYPTALSPDRIAAHWTRAASKANALCAPVPTSAYAQAVLADRPSAYYRLGDLVTDASDRVAFDSSGQCHNGAYAPRVTAQPSGALVGDVDGAITGPAFTAPAVIQSGARLPAGNSARTFEIWYRSQWGVGLLMSSGDFCLCLRGTTGAPLIQITGANGSSVFFSAPFNLQDQVWHMLDVTYDGTSATVYLDGQLIGSAALTVNTVVPGSGLQVGGGGGGNTIDSDEAAIYPTALSPDRIAAHFKRTASGPPPPIGTLSVAESSGAGNASERWCACAQTRVGGSPINAATGNFYHSFSDIAIPGRGIPLAFSRTYNSTSASTDGPLGFGWTSSYGNGMSLIQKTGAVTVVQENGAEVTFTLSAGTYSAPPRVTATLVKNADATFTFIRNARDRFTFSATGQLTQEQDLNGYSTTFVRNATRELVTVTDPAKRRLSLAWTGTHVSSVTDQTGRSVLFAYNDGQGNLTDVTDVQRRHHPLHVRPHPPASHDN